MIEPTHALMLALAPLLTGGLIYGWWAHPHSRFTTVTRDRLFHSAAMSPAKLVRVVKRRGVDVVIDFRSGQDPAVAAERAALAAAGIPHRHLPTGIAPQPAEIAAFLRTIAEELGSGRRVLMHCEDGEGRAVMFAAIYRIEFENWLPTEAYAATARLPDGLRFLCKVIPGLGCLSPRNVKTDLILNYRRSTLPRQLQPDVAAASGSRDLAVEPATGTDRS
jgi:protein tyrosine phosphatase (PTP) superfamily phosphohydrolase (DUF442 family)